MKFAPVLPTEGDRIFESPYGRVKWSQSSYLGMPHFLRNFISVMKSNDYEINLWELEHYEWIYPLISTFYNFYRGTKNSDTLPEEEK